MNSPNDSPATEELIADYLAGELSADRRARFEQMLRSDLALAADVASMRRTLQVMTDLDEGGDAERNVKTSFLRPALRYAAIIALAFIAGFAVRGGGLNLNTEPESLATNSSEVALTDHEPRSSWEQRAAEAYAKAPGGNSLGKSLIALVQTADTTRR